MILFNDLKWEQHPLYAEGLGILARVVCPNGYRASIVRTPHSYGGTSGLYELRIMGPNEQETDVPEVRGWLTPARVSHQLITLWNLPPATTTNNQEERHEEDQVGE
jgi:hypothetical protein